MEGICFDSRNGHTVQFLRCAQTFSATPPSSSLSQVVAIAEQVTATGQNKDCRTLEACLAMTELDSYGNTE